MAMSGRNRAKVKLPGSTRTPDLRLLAKREMNLLRPFESPGRIRRATRTKDEKDGLKVWDDVSGFARAYQPGTADGLSGVNKGAGRASANSMLKFSQLLQFMLLIFERLTFQLPQGTIESTTKPHFEASRVSFALRKLLVDILPL